MKIAFVSWEFPPDFGGGIGTYVATMSRLLASRGHTVRVITITKERHPVRQYLDGLEIIRLPLAICHGTEPMATLRAWQARADGVNELLARMHDLDVIEFADYRGEGVTFLSTADPSKRPACVVRLHTGLAVLNKYNKSRTRFPVLESFEDQAMLLADHLVSPSAALKREVMAHLPQVGEIALLPYPADPSYLEHPEAKGPAANEILYVGRLEERKGVESLIQAAPHVLNACREATLHLIGGDTQVSPQVASMRAKLQAMLPREFRDRVVFTDAIPRTALIERYLRARVCVFPSLFENFPNTCLEAMSLARPVVGTDNSGMAEMIEDGVSGRISRAGDASHLAEVLIDLYQRSESERHAMGQAARARMRALYLPATIGEQFEALYDGYIRVRSASRRSAGVNDGCEYEASPPVACAQGSDKPRVAVVIPCYNHGQFLADALESVWAQDWPNVECLVVDDGSTDVQTQRILKDLESQGTRIVRQSNQGLAAARNTGVRATDAPFYVALDADDRITPNFISRLIRPLLDNPALGYCYSHVRFFGSATGEWECPSYSPRKLMVENLSVATAVVRRAAFDLAGGYSPDMVHGFEDWDFWLALLAQGYHGQCVPEPLFMYRKHAPGASMLDKTQRHRAEMIQQIVQHHRALFASMLEVAVPDKDALFFHAHMQAHQLREALGSSTASPSSMAGNDLYQSLMAQAQLDHIENSGTWRMVQRLKRNPVYRLLANAKYGKNWEANAQVGTPVERLERIHKSLAYRMIQTVKHTPMHRWYARRKYGQQGAPGTT